MASYGQVTVTSTPTLVVPANNNRRGLVLDNQQGSIDVFIGPDAGITISNTVSLKAGTALVFDDHFIRTAIYGVATGPTTVGWWETSE